MSVQALRRRLDRLTSFSGGPPKVPFRAIERVVVKRDKAGRLWRKPYRRCVVGKPLLTEMLHGPWELVEEPDNGEKDQLEAEK